ncbi:TetR/AcrR family transcriptional regulator [Nonomuraea sp. NPDC050022]|uniref:TetR/AcrR family transcriptional regulator n=1 Tax=unclassified Nonomuraea TaxID=2593643 RepID=UPI0033F37299
MAGRAERANATRAHILVAAERLFAEHGVYVVSNRQISEAAGQGNNAAVTYHFGTKAELVRAIARKHGRQIERVRERMLERPPGSDDVRDWQSSGFGEVCDWQSSGSDDVRDCQGSGSGEVRDWQSSGSDDVRGWVACLVRPVTEHLAALGNPTWFARFGAQVMTDPALHEIMIDEALTSPSLVRILDGLNRCLPDLPLPVRAERKHMTSTLMMHTCADRERALAEGRTTPRVSWHGAATGLIDAIVAIWTAPVTRESNNVDPIPEPKPSVASLQPCAEGRKS